MGLIHPVDADAWVRWQTSRQPIWRRIRARRTSLPQGAILTSDVVDPRILVSTQSTNASSRAALDETARHLHDHGVAVLGGSETLDESGPPMSQRVHAVDELLDALGDLEAVVVPVGIGWQHELVCAAARRRGARIFVVQHGLLTPFSPPLPRDSTLLAWSEADGAFWTTGRDDVTVEIVGSQLFWNAAPHTDRDRAVSTDTALTFLGQLHAAELGRHELARISYRFCRDQGAVYRPHPSEIDRLSRLEHALWQRRGVRFTDSAEPLDERSGPVVSIFSTGILEAAAAGHAAWVHHPNPPPWLMDMWNRYEMQPWGSQATPPPPAPSIEPAARIADIIVDALS